MSEEDKNEDFTGVEESPKRGKVGVEIYIILYINTFFFMVLPTLIFLKIILSFR